MKSVSRLRRRLIVRTVSLIAVVLSAIWFYFERNFESAITFLAGLAGLIGSILLSEPPATARKIPANDRSRIRSDDLDAASGNIEEPTPRSIVGRTIVCRGFAYGVRPGQHLWLMVEIGKLFWPKEGSIQPEIDGRWESAIFEDGSPNQFAIGLFVVTSEAHKRVNEWLEAGRLTGKYRGFLGLPGSQRLARVDGLQLKEDEVGIT